MKNKRIGKRYFSNITDWVTWNYTATGPDALVRECSKVKPSGYWPCCNPLVEVYVKIKDGYSFDTMPESQQLLKGQGVFIDGVSRYPYFNKSSIKRTIYWQEGQELRYIWNPTLNGSVACLAMIYWDNTIIDSISFKWWCDYSRASLVKLLQRLKAVSNSPTLVLGEKLLARLTDDDKKIATDKGWTLA